MLAFFLIFDASFARILWFFVFFIGILFRMTNSAIRVFIIYACLRDFKYFTRFVLFNFTRFLFTYLTFTCILIMFILNDFFYWGCQMNHVLFYRFRSFKFCFLLGAESKILVAQFLELFLKIITPILILTWRIIKHNSVLTSLSYPTRAAYKLLILQEWLWKLAYNHQVSAVLFYFSWGLEVQSSTLRIIYYKSRVSVLMAVSEDW